MSRSAHQESAEWRALAQTSQELAALTEAIRLLTSTLDLAKVLQRLTEMVRRKLAVDVVMVWLDEKGSGDFELKAHAGTTRASDEYRLLPLPPGQGLAGWIMTERAPLVLTDVQTDPRLKHREWAAAEGLVSFLGVPLTLEDMPVGLLAAATRERRVFSPEEVALVEIMADPAAIAIRNARLYAATQQQLGETTALLEIAQVLRSSLHLGPLLREVAQHAAHAVGVDRCSLSLFRDGYVVPVTSESPAEDLDGASGPAAARAPYRVGEIPAHALAIERRAPVVVEDARASELFPGEWKERFGTRAALVVPLIRRGDAVGIMHLDYCVEARPFTESQVRLATAIASQVALAVDNTRLYAAAQERARELAALHEIGMTLTSRLDLPAVLEAVAESAAKLTGVERVAVFELDERDGRLHARVLLGIRSDQVGSTVSLGEGPPGRAALLRRPVSSADLDDEAVTEDAARATGEPPRGEAARHAGYRAVLAVPLFSKETVLGAICVYWDEVHPHDEREARSLTALAQQAAVAIENARLYERASQALAEVKAAQEQLVQSERLRALGEMAGGVAHDFNNLLTIILGRAQFVLRKLRSGEVPPTEVRRNLEIIDRAALDGAETVRRLMEFTRAAPRLGDTVSIDVNELLGQTVEVSRHRWKDEAEARGIRIEVTVEPGTVPLIAGNPAEIREVLLNLIFNAVDAMPIGGTITLSSAADGDWVCLRLRDTGIGMPAEIQARIFEPFFTTKGVQSSGLGLSASYGIIRRHGGEITVQSTPGRGTLFTIRLRAGAAPPGPEAVTPGPESGRRLRIVVIDDDGDVRETLKEILDAAGHEVWEAGSGPEGLEILRQQPVDVVITDLGMPGMTGWDVAERVKAGWPGVTTALVTGWGARLDPEELRARRIDLLLAKPFQVEEVLQSLASLKPA